MTTTTLTYRTFRTDDIDDLVEVIKANRRTIGKPELVDRDELAHQVQNPMIDDERDTEVALQDGRLVGVCVALLLPTGQSVGIEIIHPDVEDSGLRDHFITVTEERILARMDEIPEDKPVYIMRNVMEKYPDRIDQYAKRGYKEARRFYEMKIDFGDEIIDAPPLPDGIELRPFDRDAHAKVVWQAQQEAFRDHFGHVEDMPFDTWNHRLDSPTFDATLWRIAWDGDEVAGVSFNNVDTGAENTGHVDVLGVRRAWRKRGLGSGLLRHTFKMFQELGYAHVTLGVDASSKTNAVALYENAGMYVNDCMVQMRKVLRGNEADIVD